MTESFSEEKVAKLSLDLLGGLDVIYWEYSEKKGFPDAYCTQISKDVARDLRLQYQEGLFRLDTPNDKGDSLIEHAWCKDVKGTIVDLTAHQFNAYLKKPLSANVQIIYPSDPLYERYQPLSPQTKNTSFK